MVKTSASGAVRAYPGGEDGAPYYRLSAYFRKTFGETVRKISVDAHFSCPNIDGTVGRGGCVFCNATSFSPSRRFGLEDIDDQINDGIKQLQWRYEVRKFIAYFQPSTNTHAPLDVLENAYRRALRRPEIVGLAIGTRPDAVPDPVLDLLAELSREKWLALEFGIQTTNDATLRWMNRGCTHAQAEDAIRRAQSRGLRVGAHMILGLPGETREDVLLNARRLAEFRLHSIKLHHLSVIRGTRLEKQWQEGLVPLPSLEEYANLVVDFLERTPPETVVERIAGEADEEYLVAPDWTAVRHAGRNAVDVAFRNRKSWQGKLYDPEFAGTEPPEERAKRRNEA